jgi:hypothetical protein
MTHENLSDSNRHKSGTRPARIAPATSQFPIPLVKSKEKKEKKLARPSRSHLFSQLPFLPSVKVAGSHFLFKKTGAA